MNSSSEGIGSALREVGDEHDRALEHADQQRRACPGRGRRPPPWPARRSSPAGPPRRSASRPARRDSRGPRPDPRPPIGDGVRAGDAGRQVRARLAGGRFATPLLPAARRVTPVPAPPASVPDQDGWVRSLPVTGSAPVGSNAVEARRRGPAVRVSRHPDRRRRQRGSRAGRGSLRPTALRRRPSPISNHVDSPRERGPAPGRRGR